MGLVLIGLCSVGHAGGRVPAVYAENASAEISVSDGQEAARLLGSSDAKKYHKPSCQWAKKITKDNRVESASKVEAEKAGYAPCKTCFSSLKKPSAKADSTVARAIRSGNGSTKTTQ